MSDTVDGTAYLTVRAERLQWGDKRVTNAKITRVTQSKPASLNLDEIAVKITIRLPAKAFDALQPEAIVVVPESLIQHTVEVEATE
jgi:hypothetical protein